MKKYLFTIALLCLSTEAQADLNEFLKVAFKSSASAQDAEVIVLLKEQNKAIVEAAEAVRDARTLVKNADGRVNAVTTILEQEAQEDKAQAEEMRRIRDEMAQQASLQAQTEAQLQYAQSSIYATQAKMEKMRKRGWVPAPISTVFYLTGIWKNN